MQDHTYGNSYQALEPYMLYGDRSVTERLPEIQRDYTVRDLEYLQGMYPGHMKQLQEYVVRACDHLDYKNSPMYDEFPDRLMVNQVCDSICRQIEADGVVKMDELPEMEARTSEDSGNQAVEKSTEEVEVYEADGLNAQEADWMMQQQMPPGRMPPQGPPPWGPPPGPPPWGPPPRPQPQPQPPRPQPPRPQPPRPPRPPQGPPPWGPPPGPPPWGPPPGPPPWGPPPGPPPRPQPQPPRPPQGPPPWGPPPGPPPWGPPPRPPHRPGGNWLNDMIKVLLLNEMHRRRCRTGLCF